MSNEFQESTPRLAAYLLAGLAASLIGCGTPTVDAPVTAKSPKVLVVGWDGARPDAVVKAKTPAFDALMKAGAYSLMASTQTDAQAVSAPGWLSLLTGVDAGKHKVDGNDDFFEHDPAYPSFLRRARDLGLKTAGACDWEMLCALMLDEENALDASKAGNEESVTATMAKWIREEDFAVHFVHLDLPDHAGHATGFSPDNPDYIAAIEKSDQLTARLVAAIAARPTRASERWLIALVTDHGGRGTSHGARDAENQTVYFVLAGDGVQPGELAPGVTQMDLHPTVMQYLGFTPEAAWNLDGHAVGLANR